MKIAVQIDRNTDTDLLFLLSDAEGKEVDLSGYTMRMQVRPQAGAAALFDEMSTDNGRLLIEAPGRVRALITARASLAYNAGLNRFDILATAPNGRQTRIAEGTIDASAEVTR